jgi:hypothetical protein
MVILFKILYLPVPYCKPKFSASAGLTSIWKESISSEVLFTFNYFSCSVPSSINVYLNLMLFFPLNSA